MNKRKVNIDFANDVTKVTKSEISKLEIKGKPEEISIEEQQARVDIVKDSGADTDKMTLNEINEKYDEIESEGVLERGISEVIGEVVEKRIEAVEEAGIETKGMTVDELNEEYKKIQDVRKKKYDLLDAETKERLVELFGTYDLKECKKQIKKLEKGLDDFEEKIKKKDEEN